LTFDPGKNPLPTVNEFLDAMAWNTHAWRTNLLWFDRTEEAWVRRGAPIERSYILRGRGAGWATISLRVHAKARIEPYEFEAMIAQFERAVTQYLKA
jgi:hypothetical protein